MLPAEETAAARPLTPSETVYFHAEDFARPRTLLDGVALLHADAKVRATDLAQKTLAVAILAAEDAGAIRLRVGQKAKLFGLRKAPAALAERAGDAAFPAKTLEARVFDTLAGAAASDVEDLVYRLLQEDAPSPELWAIQLLQDGLVEGGVLQTERRKVLKFLPTQVYVLPDAAREAALAQPAATARRLLEETERTRPELWALLRKGVEAALKRRREAADHDA